MTDKAKQLSAELSGYGVPFIDGDVELIASRLANLSASSFLRVGVNEYGTAVDCYLCRHCQRAFTVCPAHDDRSCDDQWTGCLAETCGSYDPSRDADKLFDSGNVVAFGQRAKPDLIVRKPVPVAE